MKLHDCHCNWSPLNLSGLPKTRVSISPSPNPRVLFISSILSPRFTISVRRVASRARARSQYSFGGERVVTRHEKARGSGHVPTWAAPMRGQHAKLARPAERILRVKMRVRVRCECVGLDGRGGHGSAGRVSVMGGGCLSGIRGTDDALDTSGVELLVRVLCRAKAQVGPGVERWPPEHQRG